MGNRVRVVHLLVAAARSGTRADLTAVLPEAVRR